jgi:hypothetical protein
MTPQQIKRSIETNKLQLSFWDAISHYLIIMLFAFVPVLFALLTLYNYIYEIDRPYVEGNIWIYIVPLILSLFFYILQRRRLQFTIIETTLNRGKILALAENISMDQNWDIIRKSKTLFIAKTNPPLLIGSWGEQVTLVFNGKKILMNSICDPDKKSSVVSFGNNKRNAEKIIAGIKRAEMESLLSQK